MLFLVALLLLFQTFLNNNPEGKPLKSVGLTLKIVHTFRPIRSLSGRVVIIGYFQICIADILLRSYNWCHDIWNTLRLIYEALMLCSCFQIHQI